MFQRSCPAHALQLFVLVEAYVKTHPVGELSPGQVMEMGRIHDNPIEVENDPFSVAHRCSGVFLFLLAGSVILLLSLQFLPLSMHRWAGFRKIRSEEHTSELQSRENLVCRLLL